MTEYKLISADSHIVEPPDLYTNRIEPRFRDRAPRMERVETPTGRKYDAWFIDGQQVGTLGAVMQAGQRFEDPSQIDFLGIVGGRSARRLRSAGDGQGERDGRRLGRVPAAEPGPLLVPHPGQRAAHRHLPRLQRLDRGVLQALPRSPQGHRHAQRRRRRGGLRWSSSAAPSSAWSGRSSPSRRWPTGRIATRSTTASGGPRRTSGCRCSCTSARRAAAIPGCEFTMDLGELTGAGRSTTDYWVRYSLSAMIFAGVFDRYPEAEGRLGRARGRVDSSLAEADGLHVSRAAGVHARAGGRGRGCCRATTGAATCSWSSWRTTSASSSAT